VSVRGVCVLATVGVQAGSRASLSAYPILYKEGTRYNASRSTPALTRVERLVGVRLVHCVWSHAVRKGEADDTMT